MVYRSQRQHRVSWLRIVLAVLMIAVILVLAARIRREYFSVPAPEATLHQVGDDGYIPTSVQPIELSLRSAQAFVYDGNSRSILYTKGGDRVVYPASTSKLMSILCALQYMDADEIVMVGEEQSLVDAQSSRAYVRAGQRLTVEQLVEGMLLPSGNDAAYALAAAAGRRIGGEHLPATEAVKAFMTAVNEYGKTLGLVGTHFTVPDGLADGEHYTTVEDILLIARAAMAQPLIARFAALPQAHVVYESGESIDWVNTNQLIQPESPYYSPYVTGLKTGSLTRNYCLIFTAEKDGKSYIVGLFGGREKNDRYEDATQILRVLFGE